MQISRVLSRNLITIPREIARALEIQAGDYLKVEQEGRAVKLTPVIVEEKWLEEDFEALRALHRAERSKAQRITSKAQIHKAILGR